MQGLTGASLYRYLPTVFDVPAADARRYEIKDIMPPRGIVQAMELQVGRAAETEVCYTVVENQLGNGLLL